MTKIEVVETNEERLRALKDLHNRRIRLSSDSIKWLIEQVEYKDNMLPAYVRMLKVIEDVHDIASDADYEVNMKEIEDVTADFLYGGEGE